MKDIRRGNCPLCDHHEIIEAIPAEFGESDFERRESVTYEPRWILGGRNPKLGHGPLRTYVCRSCGFTQQFADGPDRIPIAPRYSTRIIEGVRRESPFR